MSSQGERKSAVNRLQVSVVNHCRGLRIDRGLLSKAVKLTARRHKRTSGIVELAIFPDCEIAGLHKQYFSKRTVTDVISFDMGQDSPATTGSAATIHASLALGGQVARRQAKAYRTSINKELALYAIHGMLHLLGYDDGSTDQAARMHQKEDELLTALGVGPVFSVAQRKSRLLSKV